MTTKFYNEHPDCYEVFDKACAEIIEAWINTRKSKGDRISEADFEQWIKDEFVLILKWNFDIICDEEYLNIESD